MKYLSGNTPATAYQYVVRLWNYTANDRVLVQAIQENYKKPENWQFIQPMSIW